MSPAEATTPGCTTPSRTLWTGIGSWPGTDAPDAVKIAFAECPELPYLPELPARGPTGQLVGRGTALLSGLAVDLQPAGWRLADAPGRDARLARSVFRSDLDVLEEVAQGYVGPVKVSVAGPWTLAAALERPRGDRVVADHGARRDVVQSLADGVGELVAELARRLPDVTLVVQLDEPLLPAVLTGSLSTASGFSRHRSVDRPEVAGAYTDLLDRLAGDVVGRTAPLVVVHCCASDAPVALLRQAGVAGVALDLGRMGTSTWDAVGEGLSQGDWFGAGVLPTDRPASAPPRPDAVAARLLGRLDDLGLDERDGFRTVLTPACGLAGYDRAGALGALRTLRDAAETVTERLLG